MSHCSPVTSGLAVRRWYSTGLRDELQADVSTSIFSASYFKVVERSGADN